MTNAEKYLKPDMRVAMWKDYNQTGQKCKSIWQWLDQEAKPLLTEDERVILRNIPTKYWQKICRDNYGVLEIRGEDEEIDFHTDNISDFDEYNHLFQFIKEGEEYSIEELLK